jgi:hypothetical protein
MVGTKPLSNRCGQLSLTEELLRDRLGEIFRVLLGKRCRGFARGAQKIRGLHQAAETTIKVHRGRGMGKMAAESLAHFLRGDLPHRFYFWSNLPGDFEDISPDNLKTDRIRTASEAHLAQPGQEQPVLPTVGVTRGH